MAASEPQGRRDVSVRASCSRCGAQLLPQAARCGRCGAANAVESWEECEITWRRGYAHGRFIAARLDGPGPIEVSSSQSVRLPGGHERPQEKPRVLQAVGALVAELERDGWERLGHRYEWYAYRFRRRTVAAEPTRELAATIAPYHVREAAIERESEQVAGEPMGGEEPTTVEPKQLEPLLVEPERAPPSSFTRELIEPAPVGVESSDSNRLEAAKRTLSGWQQTTTEAEPENDEPWFAEPPRVRRRAAQGDPSEMYSTILVDRISAYSIDG